MAVTAGADPPSRTPLLTAEPAMGVRWEGSAQSTGAWSTSTGTAPPTIVMASSESASMIRAGAAQCSGGDSFLDGDTASSSAGPRKRGVKRQRKFGIGADSRPHVEGRTSPLEEALRRYGDRESGPIIVPRAGMEFDSCEEAFDFYNMYSWEIGFGIRYANNRTYRRDGVIYRNMQRIVCACGGTPDVGTQKSHKQGCPAAIRMLRTDDDGWYIKDFCAEHNHPMSESCGEKKIWKSHRQIDPHTKELIRNLRANNVSMPKVSCILAAIFGSNTVTSITRRALHSLTVQMNREKSEDDVQRTIEVFNKLHDEDEGFANVVELDCYGKIKTMMWTNGKSRHDYLCFGDAITFDTTYKTNKYNMPFGLFVGVNNHFQSVIFAGVLMRDETIESFEWVFTQFVALMGGKAPQTILTDQCRAMEVALANKLPEVTHRWCKWHVFRTIKVELGRKYTEEFKKGLNKVCNHMLTPVEFEAGWADLMKKHELEGDVYMWNIYENRKMWAKANFMGKFCAKQTSTQRSESANHVLKQYVPAGASMHVFVEQYHKLVTDWNEKEDAKVHEDKLPLVGTSTGWPIESHAASFYTRTMLEKFVEHIKLGASYDVFEIIPRQRYRLNHVDASQREEWSQVSFLVDITEDGEFYSCECGLFEHMGVPCCHSVRVMMRLMVRKIPEKHLLVRWSRNGRKLHSPYSRNAKPGNSLRTSRTFRNASLSSKARELVNLGDLNIECFDYCYELICAGIEELKSRRPEGDGLGYAAQMEETRLLQSTGTNVLQVKVYSTCDAWNQLHPGVQAPDTKRGSGRPSNARDRPGHELRKPTVNRKRRCSTCRDFGHFADRCPKGDLSLKKTKEPSRCTRCKMVGHNRAACGRLADGTGLENDEF